MTQIDSNIPRHYHQLTSEQRGQIEALHDLNWSNAAIARKLHCHRSTIGRELKRGRVLQRDSDYFTMVKRRKPSMNSGGWNVIVIPCLNGAISSLSS